MKTSKITNQVKRERRENTEDQKVAEAFFTIFNVNTENIVPFKNPGMNFMV